MNDVMIDLETMGTIPELAPVISIGAVFMDLDRGLLGPTFYMALKIEDQLEKGRKIDADTLKWWLNQSDAAKKVFNEKAQPTATVLNTLGQWIKMNKAGKRVSVWGNGSGFDINILENIFRQYNIGCPWGYSDAVDLRTFKRFVAKNQPITKVGVAHNALDDALNQAKYVIYHTRPVNKEPVTKVEAPNVNQSGS